MAAVGNNVEHVGKISNNFCFFFNPFLPNVTF